MLGRQFDMQLIEVVAKFPEELMIPLGYARVSDLISGVQREFRSELDHGAGVHVSGGLLPGVPLGCESQAIGDALLERELASGAIGIGNHISREVVSAKADARAAGPFLGERCIKIISRIVGSLPDGKVHVIAKVE